LLFSRFRHTFFSLDALFIVATRFAMICYMPTPLAAISRRFSPRHFRHGLLVYTALIAVDTMLPLMPLLIAAFAASIMAIPCHGRRLLFDATRMLRFHACCCQISAMPLSLILRAMPLLY